MPPIFPLVGIGSDNPPNDPSSSPSASTGSPAWPSYLPPPGDATAFVVPVLVGAVGILQLAGTLPDGPVRSQLQASANAAIARVLDDYCVPPLRVAIWPWPGPPPWTYEIASELTFLAFREQGAMRDALLRVAAQVVGALPAAASGSG